MVSLNESYFLKSFNIWKFSKFICRPNVLYVSSFLVTIIYCTLTILLVSFETVTRSNESYFPKMCSISRNFLSFVNRSFVKSTVPLETVRRSNKSYPRKRFNIQNISKFIRRANVFVVRLFSSFLFYKTIASWLYLHLWYLSRQFLTRISLSKRYTDTFGNLHAERASSRIKDKSRYRTEGKLVRFARQHRVRDSTTKSWTRANPSIGEVSRSIVSIGLSRRVGTRQLEQSTGIPVCRPPDAILQFSSRGSANASLEHHLRPDYTGILSHGFFATDLFPRPTTSTASR